MEEIVSKNVCTGCTSCMNMCPKQAIYMEENEEGFKYPVINQEKCIDCGLCKKVCPVLNTKQNESLNKCYVGYAIEDKVKENTSSGGIFLTIANYILDNNGIVIGAAFDNENRLIHMAISDKAKLDKLKGSKYLQSDLGKIFTHVKENVNDKKILFVGTPCQVAGLKSYLQRDYDNLICIDLVCHGVPSPKLFEKYVKELEKKNSDKVINYNFRDKSTGWNNYSNTINFKNKSISQLANENNYMKLFLSDIALRESCYTCNFKLGNKYSDITLGDFWGVQNYYPEMYDKKGVSAIIINTEKGKKIFEGIKNQLNFKNCKIEEIVSGNPSLKISCTYPKKRKKFFSELNKKNIDYLAKKYARKSSIVRRVLSKVKKIIYR